MRRDRLRWCAPLLAGALCAVAATAVSAPPELAELLERLPPSAQAPLRRNAAQWDEWSPAQQSDFRARMAAWDALPRAERDARREQYAAWRALPASEQAHLQAAGERFAALPPDLQAAWRAQFDAIDRSERRGWLLGPTVGADYRMLQPLLAQVPEADHARLLAALRSMTPQQRQELGVLAQRTPPAAREALRRELLSVRADDRNDWLWRRLQH
ncbi:DUF3106 domain-containing protein [Lysobacter sp. LF1]|uniref:DUF3106 domain-containing protein n=1 Tax=Lysobacter stagni TaxID=3045172 RepID=A0ABT6XDY8_9GAMM|nr:DUF3106 domain-containing protein [Lysobacter sp. LF1]MDI9238348.1 DUF3106 domain-containing protein [Lysobacter sp. LF1]